jgi:hypothetical protein
MNNRNAAGSLQLATGFFNQKPEARSQKQKP